jgi:hypothetical protein
MKIGRLTRLTNAVNKKRETIGRRSHSGHGHCHSGSALFHWLQLRFRFLAAFFVRTVALAAATLWAMLLRCSRVRTFALENAPKGDTLVEHVAGLWIGSGIAGRARVPDDRISF